jgi:hypothetical protein
MNRGEIDIGKSPAMLRTRGLVSEGLIGFGESHMTQRKGPVMYDSSTQALYWTK